MTTTDQEIWPLSKRYGLDERLCDQCGAARALVLTGHHHGAELLTLAWCSHHYTAQERDGNLPGDVIIDRREHSPNRIDDVF